MVLREKHLPQIAEKWGLTVSAVGPPASGYRNEVWPVTTSHSQHLAIILYKAERQVDQRIKRTNALGTFLHGHGLPARRPYDERLIKLATLAGNRLAAIYHWLPGETIPWEAYTMEHLKLLGWAMGDMHRKLANAANALPKATDEYRQILTVMQTYFNHPGVVSALSSKRGLGLSVEPHSFMSVLGACDELPSQPLHMDFVRGNILFEPYDDQYRHSLKKYSLSGILDLEKAAKGPVVLDVARSLAFLLVDCKYKPEAKVRKYFLASGYVKRGGGKDFDEPGSENLLEDLISLFLLYDFYKFLLHNPYEYLGQNEHFERTKALLIKRRLLRLSDAKIREVNHT